MAVLLSSYASLLILFLNFCSYAKKKKKEFLPLDSKIWDSRMFSFRSLLYSQCFHAATQRCSVNTHWMESGCTDVLTCLGPHKAIVLDLLKIQPCSPVDFLLKIHTQCLKNSCKGKHFGISSELSRDTEISYLSVYPRELKTYSYKNLCTTVYHITVHN